MSSTEPWTYDRLRAQDISMRKFSVDSFALYEDLKDVTTILENSAHLIGKVSIQRGPTEANPSGYDGCSRTLPRCGQTTPERGLAMRNSKARPGLHVRCQVEVQAFFSHAYQEHAKSPCLGAAGWTNRVVLFHFSHQVSLRLLSILGERNLRASDRPSPT